eukprot:jgi/Botrbrau1/23038/Bobra.136_1s0027.1
MYSNDWCCCLVLAAQLAPFTSQKCSLSSLTVRHMCFCTKQRTSESHTSLSNSCGSCIINFTQHGCLRLTNNIFHDFCHLPGLGRLASRTSSSSALPFLLLGWLHLPSALLPHYLFGRQADLAPGPSPFLHK